MTRMCSGIGSYQFNILSALHGFECDVQLVKCKMGATASESAYLHQHLKNKYDTAKHHNV